MNTSNLRRRALSVCAAVLALAACGGSQSISPKLSQNTTVSPSNSGEVGVSHVYHDSNLFEHHHYKLIDMGGPISTINLPFFGTNLSKSGVTIGWSAFSTPTGPYSSFFVCGGLDGLVPYITHAFEWNGEVRDLGALYPQKTNCSWPSGVNAAGDVVGASENGQIDPFFGINQARAVVWTHGKIINLGTLGGYESSAFAINDRGQIVGNSTNTIPDPYCFGSSDQNRAWLLQGGKMKDLGTLGGNCAGTTNGGINNNGWIVGNSTTSTMPNPITGIPPWDPFLWQKGKGMTDLGSLGGAYGGAYGLNESGQIFGVSSIASDPGACNGFPDNQDYNCHSFLWKRGRLRDLSTTSIGGTPQQVQRINRKGEMVGWHFQEHAGCIYLASRRYDRPRTYGWMWERGAWDQLA